VLACSDQKGHCQSVMSGFRGAKMPSEFWMRFQCHRSQQQLINSKSHKTYTMKLTKEVFKHLWDTECRGGEDTNSEWSHHAFRSVFGIWDCEAAYLWNVLDEPNQKRLHHLQGWRPKCLLDGLHFLKTHGTESATATFCGRDEKTLRKWNWLVAAALASQDWVRCYHCYSHKA